MIFITRDMILRARNAVVTAYRVVRLTWSSGDFRSLDTIKNILKWRDRTSDCVITDSSVKITRIIEWPEVSPLRRQCWSRKDFDCFETGRIVNQYEDRTNIDAQVKDNFIADAIPDGSLKSTERKMTFIIIVFWCNKVDWCVSYLMCWWLMHIAVRENRSS